MGQTNEDVVKGQPSIVPAKSRCDSTAIKKCTSKMRNGSTIMNKNGGKSKHINLAIDYMAVKFCKWRCNK